MSKAQIAVLLELWNVTDLGKVNEWITDDRLNLEASVNDPVLLQLRVLIDKQNDVDNHMLGITSTGWRDFLEGSLGISPEVALSFQVSLYNKSTQFAIDKMWKARNIARHALITALITTSQPWGFRTVEAAIRSWKSDAKRKGLDIVVCSEDKMRAWPRAQKLIWVHNRLKPKGYHGILDFTS